MGERLWNISIFHRMLWTRQVIVNDDDYGKYEENGLDYILSLHSISLYELSNRKNAQKSSSITLFANLQSLSIKCSYNNFFPETPNNFPHGIPFCMPFLDDNRNIILRWSHTMLEITNVDGWNEIWYENGC